MSTQPTPETSNGRVVIAAPDDGRYGEMGEARLSKPAADPQNSVWAVTLDSGQVVYRAQRHLRWLTPEDGERLEAPDLHEAPVLRAGKGTVTPEQAQAALQTVALPPAAQPVKGKVYISGPMTGIPDHNRDAFYEAERVLRTMGYDTINPARVDEEEGMLEVWHDFLARDMALILKDPAVTGVVFIEGWRNSRGATLEGYIAQQGGKKLWELVYHQAYPAEDGVWGLRPVENVSVAYAAQSVVLGARRYAYGHPLDNFLKIAELWNATIGHKLSEPLDVRDVAMLMIQVKVAREYNAPKEDNQVDVCGYALAYQEALNEIVRRGGDLDGFLSTNAALLRQHSVLGTDSNARPE